MNDKDFLSIIKNIDPEYTENPETTTSFLDSGSYILNALLSGSLYGGFPSNKVSALAGEEAVGKSFFAMSAVKAFQEKYPDSFVVYFDSEFALDRSFLEKRGINSKRVHIMQCETLQDFRTRALKLLDNYKDMNPRPKMMLVLDSLSNLPSNKEIQDGLEDKDVRDMTKNQLIRSIFRSITTKLGKYDVPMIVTSHVYQIIGSYIPTKEISGGGGLKYAASSILMISKKKDKDGTDVVGNILKLETAKSRYSKSNQKVELKLDFHKGLDRYYGLLDLAEKYEVIKKVTAQSYEMPDGTKVKGTYIRENLDKIFTKEMLDILEPYARKEYSLGEIENDDITDQSIDEEIDENNE